MIAALLLACGAPPATEAPPGPAPLLDDAALLTRLSIDLRGVRPTPAELERLAADPTQLDVLRDEFLQDPRFEGRVADLFSEVWLTRSETFPVNFEAFDLEGVAYADLVRSVGEQPLRTVGYVAANDLPVTDLVTADWTLADPILGALWPVDYPAGDDGWRKVKWTDTRPSAGVLVSNSLYWRFPSTDSNANRKRANQVSRILLCHDYLTRPIEFDRNVNLLDEGALADALRTNEACVNCHNTLDPLSAYFFGFWTYEFTSNEVSQYHPSRERLWSDYLGTAPGFYGEPGDGLADLGWQIAADERFPQCLTQQVTELLLRRDADLLDADSLTAHREALLSDLTLRPLFRSVVSSPEYRNAESDPEGRNVPSKMVTVDLLASTVEELTGFRWIGTSGQDLLRTDAAGFQTLAGGADGVTVTTTAREPNTTLLLVQERLAEAAADYVVEHDLADPGAARLFTGIDFTETPDTDRDAVVAQLRALHLRVLGHDVAADGPEVAANLELWSELYTVDGDVPRVWRSVLTALLRDPDFLFY
jgi:hypothetical protein